MSLRCSSPTSSADETLEDELLRAVERQIQENARNISSAQPSQPGCCPPSPSSLVRGVTRRVFGVATGSSPPRSPPRGQASSDVTGTSALAPRLPARTGSEEEAKPEQDQAALTRSGYGAIMGSALANIQEDAEGQELAPFAKMEEATGLMELTYGKAGLSNPPELPRKFATRWPHDDDDLSHSGVMDDAVILVSGHSVDRSYHQWFCPLNNVCPITNKTLSHSSTAPNHLLHDMSAALSLDHLAHSPSRTADKLSVPVAPTEEQIQDILKKFSGHSVMQEQALHEIQLLSKITKGEQPCLHNWPGLFPELIDLQKNWKSTWTQNLEEERLGVILNLSVHRTSREILARENRLPVALKKIVAKLHKHGSPASAFSKVASIVAILSEFDMFRKGILDIGGMEMLRDLLKIEDAVVRKEAVTAIRGLCADEEGKTNAQSYNVSDILLECLMVSDEVLLLLDCLPKDPCVVDKMCDKAVELVNIIMAEQATGPVTPEVTYSAISLVHAIVQRHKHKVEMVKNLEDFKERLRELSSGILPTKTRLHVESIIKVLSMSFQTPPKLSGFLAEEDILDHPHNHSRPKEFTVRWSLVNDEISYPLYAEVLGEAGTTLQSRKEWSDVRIVRKMRPLRLQEKVSSRTHFAMIQRSWRTGKRMPCPIYMSLEDPKDGKRSTTSGVPQILLCSLCKKVMVDPVTVATGESFGRQCIESWFEEKGYICPVTKVPVSAIVLRNERIRDYLVEWRAAESED